MITIYKDDSTVVKKTLFVVLFALSIVLITLFEGCNNDPKPNPCSSKTPTSAKFTIGERITNYPSGNGKPGIINVDTVIVSDTVINDQQIVFQALDENDSYEWSIGDDPLVRTGKKVSLWFSAASGNFSLPSTISVRLIVKKKIDKACFPMDDGIDTLIQNFTIIEQDQNPLAGVYEGYLKSKPTEIFSVKISYIDQVVGDDGLVYSPLPTFMVDNFLKDCNNKIWWWGANRMAYGFRSINFSNSGHVSVGACKAISGWIFIDKKGNIQIPFYRISDDIKDTSLSKDVFFGKKKN